LYQLLLGAWPAELTGVASPDPAKISAFAARIEAAMIKSLRESKLRSTWASPDTPYEEAVLEFVRDALEVSRPFLGVFLPFQERIARLGVRNSLVQTVLKLTLPGIPDFYQGAELWDLSLVDPDNRRPVDYQMRIEELERIAPLLELDRAGAMLDMLEHWHDGRIKLAVIATLLAYRREHPDPFEHGRYEPLSATGCKAEQVCAFTRNYEGDALMVAAARFPSRLESDPDLNGTEISCPPTADRTDWRDLLCGHLVKCHGEAVDAAAVLRYLPIAMLVPADG
jgi:(1->4)-alpha-D-glucan 1-alpha-D-glucosylmutase